MAAAVDGSFSVQVGPPPPASPEKRKKGTDVRRQKYIFYLLQQKLRYYNILAFDVGHVISWFVVCCYLHALGFSIVNSKSTSDIVRLKIQYFRFTLFADFD